MTGSDTDGRLRRAKELADHVARIRRQEMIVSWAIVAVAALAAAAVAYHSWR